MNSTTNRTTPPVITDFATFMLLSFPHASRPLAKTLRFAPYVNIIKLKWGFCQVAILQKNLSMAIKRKQPKEN